VREVERRREERDIWFGELLRKDREMQKEERRRRIRDSKYNRWYEAIRTEAIPEYLKRGWGESRWRRIIRFRLGNEVKESL